ncbi:MAG TPA: glycoside hydrolase family 3 N-terminal domain-containing protein [Nevskiaceae bacterium]|nr:glycoside hydrolase family 3 N-terminal domain-containing protein [Nevskiaceae bacterium]
MSDIEALIAAMTLPEKLGQMTMVASGYVVTGPVIVGDSTASIRNGTVGNLLNMVGADHVNEMQRLAVEESRLGIPLMIGLDIIHGHRTLFPIPLAQAGLFDDELWERMARESAAEACADGLALTFAPMLDVARDPRWGRIAEGPGEDPLVASRMAVAAVRGYQGKAGDADLASSHALAACAKHFCAYGAVTAGRDYTSAEVSERSLQEVYLPPFEAAVKAGVASVMPAFNDVAGVPMTAHRRLLRDTLRGSYGFDGVIISDYNAIAELIRHGVARDLTDAAILALKAGVDIDMMADAYRKGLPRALEQGRVTMAEIDAAVRRVLTLKQRLGLFDDPYRRGREPEPQSALADRRRVARESARRSMVLLENRAATLPWTTLPRNVALIGPLADADQEMRGPWWAAGEHEPHIGVLRGLRANLPETEFVYAKGVDVEGGDLGAVAAATLACEHADAVLLCLGESSTMSGEAACRAAPGLPGHQRELAEAVLEAAHRRGVRVTVILFSGRPLVVPWLAGHADALLAAWFPGTEAGNALADLLTGRVSPSGRTAVTWPRAVGQIPIHYAQRGGGRPENPQDHYTSKYLDLSNRPLYPFGYGLGYGHCRYANLRLSPQRVGRAGVITARVTVTNEGQHAQRETVFLFVHDVVASVARPVLELQGWATLELEPGQSADAVIAVAAQSLCFPGLDLELAFEAGEVEVFVGPCADRERLLKAVVSLVA